MVFEDIDINKKGNSFGTTGKNEGLPDSTRISELERELQVTREVHQTAIEELESSNEELKSTNEEIQSSNEELQSTNEELESSKEELQSLNEELQTVNSELQSKVDELSLAHNDMHNLMNSTEIATIFVDNDLQIRRFTSEATSIINLIQTDIGRPLQHVVSNLKYDNMINDLVEVVQHLTPKECEVQTTEGKWFNMRLMPYRTTDNRIDGAVLTFSNIEDQKMSHEKLQASLFAAETAWELVRAIFDISEDPMAVVDKENRIVIANTQYSRLINAAQRDIRGMDFFTSQENITDAISLRSKLKKGLENKTDFTSGLIKIKTHSGEQSYIIQSRPLNNNSNVQNYLLLQFLQKN